MERVKKSRVFQAGFTTGREDATPLLQLSYLILVGVFKFPSHALGLLGCYGHVCSRASHRRPLLLAGNRENGLSVPSS